MTPQKQILTLSQNAIDRIRFLISQKQGECHGIRLDISTKGCSGLSYTLDYVEEISPQDEHMEIDGVNLYIDPKAILFILGTEMDFTEDKIQSGFVFRNPNEKGRCGCGKSFHV